MNSQQLVDLAYILGTESETLIHGTRSLCNRALDEYWIASRCRLLHWLAGLKELEQELREQATIASETSQRLKAVVTEITHADVLTRVWTSLLFSFEAVCPIKDCECIGRSVFVGQLEVRNRVMRILTHDRNYTIVRELNALRLNMECRTDLLLAYPSQVVDVANFGYQPQRVRDFTKQIGRNDSLANSGVLAALRLSLSQPKTNGESPCDELNSRITSSILATLGPEIYGGTGRLAPLWQTRMMIATAETIDALDSILNEESQAVEPSVGQRRF